MMNDPLAGALGAGPPFDARRAARNYSRCARAATVAESATEVRDNVVAALAVLTGHYRAAARQRAAAIKRQREMATA